ncbi:MAG: ATP-dependent DNA ligase [Nitriliruptor sp.]|nr:MAG: ATP-dependent DNA ligase [Nitriliruptor sp.]
MDAGEQRCFSRTIDISNVDKVFFPDAGLTKGELLDYHVRIAELLLAHLDGRPVAVKRYPDGLEGQGFFQKNAGSHFPDWLRRQDIPKRDGGTLDHVVVDEPAALVYLADQGTIEFHPWLSLADDLEHPVELVLDLDPPAQGEVGAVRQAARQVHTLLDELEVASRIKTSGSAGFHVHVPLDGSAGWDVVSALARSLAEAVCERHPDALTTSHRKQGRTGRVFVDWLRNSYGQTSVAAYSVRARPGAPVATPIDWGELRTVEPRSYDVGNLFRRLGQRDDPWRDDPPAAAAAQVSDRLEALREDG